MKFFSKIKSSIILAILMIVTFSTNLSMVQGLGIGFDPEIFIMAPTAGEEVNANTDYDIKWDNGLEGGYESVDIHYQTSINGEWNLIVEDYFTDRGGEHSYSWTVPNVETDNAMIRIQGYPEMGDDGYPDYFYSDVFSIVDPAVEPLLGVRFPNGGEVLRIGTQSQILWKSQGIEPSEWIRVQIGYTLWGKTRWRTIGYSRNDGHLAWRVVGPITRQALARVSLMKNPDINDTSDDYFSIIRGGWFR